MDGWMDEWMDGWMDVEAEAEAEAASRPRQDQEAAQLSWTQNLEIGRGQCKTSDPSLFTALSCFSPVKGRYSCTSSQHATAHSSSSKSMFQRLQAEGSVSSNG